MENRSSGESYFQFSPVGGVHGSLHRTPSLSDRERYLAELLAERQTMAPFVQILPACTRLLNHEIMRVSRLVSNPFLEEQMGDEYMYGPLGQQLNRGMSPMGAEDDRLVQKMAQFQPTMLNQHLAPNTPITPIVKRVIRLDIPVDKYPNYNFVGRILGPRGNSLKRFEAATQCRIFIRGLGSVKDSVKEEKLKDKPGYEHLNEPLHILLEAEFPEDIVDSRVEQAVAILEKLLKPMDESMDVYKKEQLRELAMLNGTFREESPSMSPSLSPSMSPFTGGLKRAKTGR